MEQNYLLVEWVHEGRYSSVSHNSVINEEAKALPIEDLIGRTLTLKWGKKEYEGIVHQYGKKVDMDHEACLFAKTVGSKAVEDVDSQIAGSTKRKSNSDSRDLNKKKANENTYSELTSVLTRRECNNSDDLFPMEYDTVEIVASRIEIDNLRSQLQTSNERAQKYKDLAKARKREIKDLKKTPVAMRTQNVVELGENVFIPKDKLDTIRALSDSPNIFARNLMRVLFENEELVGRSMFGKPCNILKYAPILPSIDPARRDAIIIFTMKQFGHEIIDVTKKKRPILTDLRRSMGDFLREQTSKYRKSALEMIPKF